MGEVGIFFPRKGRGYESRAWMTYWWSDVWKEWIWYVLHLSKLKGIIKFAVIQFMDRVTEPSCYCFIILISIVCSAQHDLLMPLFTGRKFRKIDLFPKQVRIHNSCGLMCNREQPIELLVIAKKKYVVFLPHNICNM